jgi:hypothetical protein
VTDSIRNSYFAFTQAVSVPFPTAVPGAMGLLVGETQGFAIDATFFGGSVAVKDTGTPANNKSNVLFTAGNITQASTSGKYVRDAAGVLTLLSVGVIPQSYDPIAGRYGILLEPAATNLALRSQEFDNPAWTTQASSVTANAAVAPDGTTTADSLVEDTSGTTHTIRQNITITANVN